MLGASGAPYLTYSFASVDHTITCIELTLPPLVLASSTWVPPIFANNKSLFSSTYLSLVHLLHSFSINNVLYVRRFLFNLLSLSHLSYFLNCVIYFTKDTTFFLQNWSSRQMVSIECEFNRLYQLQTSTPVGS